MADICLWPNIPLVLRRLDEKRPSVSLPWEPQGNSLWQGNQTLKGGGGVGLKAAAGLGINRHVVPQLLTEELSNPFPTPSLLLSDKGQAEERMGRKRTALKESSRTKGFLRWQLLCLLVNYMSTCYDNLQPKYPLVANLIHSKSVKTISGGREGCMEAEQPSTLRLQRENSSGGIISGGKMLLGRSEVC